MHLYKKIKKGKEYYYLRQTKRINGKVSCVFQLYIGNKERLFQSIQSGLDATATIPQPSSTKVFHFGSVATLLTIAKELHLFKIIDKAGKKRKQDVPLSIYLITAAINRCINPKSKKSLGLWLEHTSLERLLPQLAINKMTSQHFWNHMSLVSETDIKKMEDKIVKRVTEAYALDLDVVLYDSTNYYSYIHSFNERSEIEQRGRNKQKRYDLRQANLALLVTKEHHIPLYHRIYQGNENDLTAFHKTILALKEKRDLLSRNKSRKFILVFDNGNVSETNMKMIKENEFQFISKLKPSNHRKLFEIPLSQYNPLPTLKGACKACRMVKKLYGSEMLIVIKYNPTHYEAEYKTINRTLKTVEAELQNLSKRLEEYIIKGSLPGNVNQRSIQNHINHILKGKKYVTTIIDISISEVDHKYPRLTWQLNQRQFHKYCDTYLGKTIYFSNIVDMCTEELLETYSYQLKIEDVFKMSKNRRGGCWWPKYHWTDQKIKVHGFYCFLSLLLLSSLEYKAEKMCIKMDVHRLVEELHDIKEVQDSYINIKGKTATLIRHTDLNRIQKKLFQNLGLNDFLP